MMKRQIRIIGVLVIVLIGLMAFSATAHAAAPDDAPLTEQEVQEIIERLENAEDPTQEFIQLSSSEQEAVIEYLKVVTVEVHMAIMARDPSDNSGCSTNYKTIKAKSLAGNTLYIYHSQTYWCWNGSEITNDPHFTRSGRPVAPFWEFVGHLDKSESGGKGDWEHRDYTQGHFRLCFPLIGCYQNAYPDISKIQRGDGTSSAY